MTYIILRRDKGSKLTHGEMDDNLNILNTSKVESVNPSTSGVLTHSGDINLSGAGKRITGDFSNPTVSNRIMFQSSAINSGTAVTTIPNGSSQFSAFQARSTNQLGNSHNIAQFGIENSGTEVRFSSEIYGAVTYLPMTFHVGGRESFRIDTDGRQSAIYGAANAGVFWRTGSDYESQGTIIKPVSRSFIHDYRPLGVSHGGTAPFSADGANTFVGHSAGNFTMSPDNSAIGDDNIHCSYNAGFGTQSLGALTTGYNNAGCGVNALRENTQGYSNAALGRDCLEQNTTGSYNSSVGQSALRSNLTGVGNVAIGGKAGYDLLSGSYNVFVGFSDSGAGITSGNYNTIIGAKIASLGNVSSNVVLSTGNGVVVQHTNSSGNTSFGGSFTPVSKHHFKGLSSSNGSAKRTVVIDDDSAFAAGVGGGVSLRFKYNSAGAYGEAANIKAEKENATDGNYAGAMVFSTQANGAAPAEAARITSTKDFLLTSGVGSIGYGSGGSVSQLTSRATGVTINKPSGDITLFSAAGTTAATTFAVTNSMVGLYDTPIISVRSATNKYITSITNVAIGSFDITFYTTGGTASDTPILHFNLLKGSIS